MKKKMLANLIIIAIITTASLFFVSSIPFVKGEDLSGSTITADPTTVYSLKNSTITVTVMTASSDPISGATVGISVEGGEFPDGTQIYNDTSNVNGEVIVQWKAPPIDEEATYNFTAIITMIDSTSVKIATQVLVLPLDISSSTLEAAPEEINESENTQIIATVEGAGGGVEGAHVQFSCIAGKFNTTNNEISEGMSDATGKYTDAWTAPAVNESIDFLIIATITYFGSQVFKELEINITVNPVEGQLMLDISVSPGYDLEVGEVATIAITVTDNETSLAVEDALLMFNAIDGDFNESDSDYYEGYTDTQGKIIVHWETETLVPDVVGTIYPIFITAAKIGLLTNYTTLEFFVQEAVDISVSTTSSETTITQGESVTITVTVEVDGAPQEDSYVTISGQAGTFEESSTDEVSGYTNAQGEFTTTWDTSEVVMVGADPIDFTFTITVFIFPYPDQISNYGITVNPDPSKQTTAGPLKPTATPWWFWLVLGAILVAASSALTAIIIRNRRRGALFEEEVPVYTCCYCGAGIKRDGEKCPRCKEPILRCAVCTFPITYAEEVGECSLCGARGHFNHLLEAVKMLGECPICGQTLPYEGLDFIIEYDVKKKKKKKR